MFEIDWTDTAKEAFEALKADASQKKRYKAVRKAIKFLAQNPCHPSLETHEFESVRGSNGEKTFEAYAEQNTPNAYRFLWYYGPSRGEVTILAILPHPSLLTPPS